jgi:hypothetical protein
MYMTHGYGTIALMLLLLCAVRAAQAQQRHGA